MTRVRHRLVVNGVVQGVGFRPFVYATASELALTGEVSNDSSGVRIEVEGEATAVLEFARRVEHEPPPLAVVESLRVESAPVRGGTGFRIADTSHHDGGRTLASPDVAICADCLSELCDPHDRRYRHAFITCTNCGPRFTIIRELPYDRRSTTMAQFPMCERCTAEYRDPADRRFHAQPIACPDCGPVLEFVEPQRQPLAGERALERARSVIAAGGIVAVKGIGGVHLACDARSPEAVAKLRERKRRRAKPFAVMVRDLSTARHVAHVDASEERVLTSPQRPILLLRKNSAGRLADGVAPGIPDLGVMLAYTPLHHLLLGLPGDPDGPDALVMTSGNLGGEPIAFRNDDAVERLREIADAWLMHDRPILVPCDDSVVRVVDGAEMPLRRSRGYAPMPLALPVRVPPALAVGADVKNTCAVAEGRYAWLSQHVGDMDDLATLEAFSNTERHLQHLTGVEPQQVIADAHPDYRSVAWARRHASGRPLRSVQHHHAHLAAVMGEHGLGAHESVVGFAYDGTGYGTDGAIWGGEVLIGGYKEFRRFAHLKYVPLPGGDLSVERPYRMALAHLYAAGIPWADDLAPVQACPVQERQVLWHQLQTGFGCTPTSSFGRLFDAIAALCGVRQRVDYEAEAAIELEGLSRGIDGGEGYRFALVDDVADPAPMLRALLEDLREGVPAGVVGARFHAAVADLTLRWALAAHDETALEAFALTGGVFQNSLLHSLVRVKLANLGFTAYSHHRVPPNDGGIALGQLLVGCSQ
ncbi:carbamoyltransferase HypF [Hoyosella subflava]|uniref:Carbamoyltransferase n=1 Tax=Hoyosella subflava (strain DSM 45089 / JCM 17490 / NBRC 109087 / DQS3-9A1) TaxID=443218 RepID=F6ENF9_HOYSD|nr:carbamoyltransferase HypF [Hoyosella subflava]AEF40430.1 (NiFe) hydrogenase maturation protein HypF [Hoyosella subflava DQS3-9A1]